MPQTSVATKVKLTTPAVVPALTVLADKQLRPSDCSLFHIH